MIGPLLLCAAVGFLVLRSTKTWHPAWWAKRILRYGLYALAALVPLGLVMRRLGVGRLVEGFHSAEISILGGVLGGGGAIVLLSLFLSMPTAAVLRKVLAWAFPDHPEEAEPKAASPSRRTLLRTAAVAAIPLVAGSMAGIGVVSSFAATKIVPRPMAFASLPESLAGLRILQITDLHLGAFLSPSAIPEIVARAKAAKPDLVVLTGDICDYLPWLPDALKQFESIAPRYGLYATLGNHEHYRGTLENVRAYGRTNIRLLLDEHETIRVGDSRLLLMGVDDPSGWGNDDDHYPRRADVALNGAPSDADFRLALCHRPSGFRALAARGMDLTLSGHTHGAQVGAFERSVLEPFLPDKYMWGRYEHAGKQLYTSSGAGHWAAFRLACPSEAALVTLERA